MTTKEYTLLGAEFSLYSGKTRAHLRYKGVPFIERPPSREDLKSYVYPVAGSVIVPVLITPEDEPVQDTTDILDFVEQRFPKCSVYPETPRQRLVALMLELFGDEWLVIAAMHYRWNYLDEHSDFIFGEFGSFSAPDATREERIAIGKEVGQMFRGMTPRLGAVGETMEGVESSYLKTLGFLNEHFASHDFLLGSRPSVGDFGLLGPLYAHLCRDPYPKEIMERSAPNVAAWVARMNNPQPLSGEFLENDEVPETLVPLLKQMAEEQLPVLLSTVSANEAYMLSHPGDNIPRTTGEQDFIIGEKLGTRKISSFSQWMFQRPLFFYQSLTDDDKAVADQLLENVGAYGAFQTVIQKKVKRKKGQLELVEA